MRTALAGLAMVGAMTTAAIAESRTFDMPAFTEVSVGNGITAIVEAGPAQAVVAEASSASVLNRLEVDVRGGRLALRADWGFFDSIFNFGRRDEIVVHVTAPSITAGDASSGANLDLKAASGDRVTISASSGAAVDASGVNAAILRTNASSGARLKLAGTCGELTADASSGANIDAAAIPCDGVSANASSGARVAVRANNAVDANASSGGGIDVYGAPAQVRSNASSGGTVNVRN